MAERENAIITKCKDFSLRIIKLYQYMIREQKEYALSKQVLRSGTSIGANVIEAQAAQSGADFISKLSISLKETRETKYWLELLYRSEYITERQFQSIIKDANEIDALLTAIVKTNKNKFSD